MSVPMILVDAFTAKPFSGNPAAVCILPEPPSEQWMHDVAREMNLSETAFLVRQQDGFDLRWFTPTVEVQLCGHATLASAHVFWVEGYLPPGEQARFHTASGLLTANRKGDWIELDFPSQPEESAIPPSGLLSSLGVEAQYVGRNRTDYLVLVNSEKILREIRPDWAALGQVDCRGIAVTSRSTTDEYDFVSRFFAPKSGILEDPVTGSSHCCLGPFWAARLNKTELVAYQASARGGVVKMKVVGDRVLLGGQAVSVMHGTIG
ncbi:MAG: oxidoreductase [SAR202 cluster bacterium Io17-Chloro-G7]|nr:MAG: oxidoreductase [SAR202 cluster bacterium Io17-Chloro-G7]